MAYSKLWKYNGKTIGHTSFINFTMEGWMRKRAENASFFQIDLYPKRYFRVDFTKAVIVISHNKDEKQGSGVKIVPFREVNKIARFKPEYERAQLVVCHKKYRYGFQVQTNSRIYELYTTLDDEREMWLTGFEYVFMST